MGNNRIQPSEGNKFMSLLQVLKEFPVSRSTLYAMIKRKEFPSPIKFSQRRSLWSRKVITDWIDNKLT